jgi:hypothetical protein
VNLAESVLGDWVDRRVSVGGADGHSTVTSVDDIRWIARTVRCSDAIAISESERPFTHVGDYDGRGDEGSDNTSVLREVGNREIGEAPVAVECNGRVTVRAAWNCGGGGACVVSAAWE